MNGLPIQHHVLATQREHLKHLGCLARYPGMRFYRHLPKFGEQNPLTHKECRVLKRNAQSLQFVQFTLPISLLLASKNLCSVKTDGSLFL